MSFSFSGVMKFANKLKDSVSSNVNSFLQSSDNQSGSIKESISGVFQSVKSGSIAMGSKIAQTAESLLTKNTELISVVIAPNQIKYIIDNLEKNYNNTCFLKNTVQLEQCIIPHGYCPHSIQGAFVDCMSYELIIDVFYMVRNHSCISVEFTNNPIQLVEKQSCIDIYSCMLYLFPHYDSFSTPSSSCRRSVISNHYLTLRTLSRFNNSLDLNLFLNPLDMEHLIVVDRLFIQSLRQLCPRPFIRLPPEGKCECPQSEATEIAELVPHSIVSLIECVFRFCQVVYLQCHMMPSKDLMSIFCIGNNNAYFSSLILHWPSLENDMRVEILLAREICFMNPSSLLYDSPNDLKYSFISDLSKSLSVCESQEQMHSVISDSSHLSGPDLFTVLLRRINVSLIPEWVLQLILIVNKTKCTRDKLMRTRHLIQLLPQSIRFVLYWILRCIEDCEQEDKVLEAVVTFWFRRNFGSSGITFLRFVLVNLYYVFIPVIPEETALLGTEENSSVFSMKASFSTLHSLANEAPCDSHSVVDEYYETGQLGEMIDGEVKWISPTQFITPEQPTSTSIHSKPELPVRSPS